MNTFFVHWNQAYWNGIEINDDTIPNALLFADEDYQVLLSDSGWFTGSIKYFAQHKNSEVNAV